MSGATQHSTKAQSEKPRRGRISRAAICMTLIAVVGNVSRLDPSVWYILAGYVRGWGAAVCEYYESTIASGKLVRETMKHKRLCQAAALVVASFGVFGIYAVDAGMVSPDRMGWTFHQSSWNFGGGILGFVTITKYNKIPAYFQAAPACTEPVRWPRPKMGRVRKRRKVTSRASKALPPHRVVWETVRGYQRAVQVWGVGRFRSRLLQQCLMYRV